MITNKMPFKIVFTHENTNYNNSFTYYETSQLLEKPQICNVSCEVSETTRKRQCERCLSKNPQLECLSCNNRLYCGLCYNMTHKVGKFQFHTSQNIDKIQNQSYCKTEYTERNQNNNPRKEKQNNIKAKVKLFDSQKQIRLVNEVQENHRKMLQSEINQVWAKVKKQLKESMNTISENLIEKLRIMEDEIEQKRIKQIQNLNRRIKNSYNTMLHADKLSPRKEINRSIIKQKREIQAKSRNIEQLTPNKYYNEYHLLPNAFQEINSNIRSLELKKIIQSLENQIVIQVNSIKNIKSFNSHKASQSQIKNEDSIRKYPHLKSKNKSQLYNPYIVSRKSIPAYGHIPCFENSIQLTIKDQNVTLDNIKSKDSSHHLNAKYDKFIMEGNTKLKRYRKNTNEN